MINEEKSLNDNPIFNIFSHDDNIEENLTGKMIKINY
jgi:hypothetical protein